MNQTKFSTALTKNETNARFFLENDPQPKPTKLEETQTHDAAQNDAFRSLYCDDDGLVPRPLCIVIVSGEDTVRLRGMQPANDNIGFVDGHQFNTHMATVVAKGIRAGTVVHIRTDHTDEGVRAANEIAAAIGNIAPAQRCVCFLPPWFKTDESGSIVKRFGERAQPTEAERALDQEPLDLAHDIPLEFVRPVAPANDNANDDNRASDWPEPEPLDAIDVPAFPVHALPGVLRALVVSIADAMQVPTDLAANYAIGTAAAALRGRLVARLGPDWNEPVGLYIATALPPGERKSPVAARVTAPIRDFERELANLAKPLVAQAREARAIQESRLRKLRKTAGEANTAEARDTAARDAAQLAIEMDESPLVVSPVLIVDDVTPEQLATIMEQQQGRLAVISAEGTMIDAMVRYQKGGAPAYDTLLKAHAGETIRISRRVREEHIAEPRLTIVIAMQPSHLGRFVSHPEAAGRGLVDRFLISLPASRVGFRRTEQVEINREAMASFSGAIRRLLIAFHPLDVSHEITITPAALDVFQAWRKEREPMRRPSGEHGHIPGFASKSEGALGRIAAVFAAIDAAEKSANVLSVLSGISEEHVRNAATVMDYFLAHASAVRYLGRLTANDSDIQLVAARLLEMFGRREATFSRRELHRNVSARFPAMPELTRVLAVFESKSWIRPVDAGNKPGRPSKQFELSPRLGEIADKTDRTPAEGKPGAK